jgi:hypothetical protein
MVLKNIIFGFPVATAIPTIPAILIPYNIGLVSAKVYILHPKKRRRVRSAEDRSGRVSCRLLFFPLFVGVFSLATIGRREMHIEIPELRTILLESEIGIEIRNIRGLVDFTPERNWIDFVLKRNRLKNEISSYKDIPPTF